MEFEFEHGRHGKDSTNGCEFSNRSIGIKVVYSGNLGKPLHNEMGFVTNDISVSIFLKAEYPLGAGDIGIHGFVDKLSGVSS
jgi:hypothetical protein